MLTEILLKSLKPKEKGYKVSDRDGLYAFVSTNGTISFRCNYRINGRQETYTFGVWKKDLTLAEARMRLQDIKKMIASGQSPMINKKEAQEKNKQSGSVGQWVERYFESLDVAESTKKLKRYVINGHILKRWENWKLNELSFEAIRKVCDEINEGGAPATAIQVRNIMVGVYEYAIDHGEKLDNVARRIRPSSIHTFQARDRALSECEIASLNFVLSKISSASQLKHALKLLLLTLVRKGELIGAKWSEIDFENATWEIPKERMKMGRPHVVYLSRQAVDLFVGLNYMALGSEYVLPARSNLSKHISEHSLNRLCRDCVAAAEDYNIPLEKFSPHDLRRTGSTLLHEYNYTSDWIEKALAHELPGGIRRVYNKAEYAEQRRQMLQDWADLIDSFSEKYKDQFDESLTMKSVRQLRLAKQSK